MARKDKDQELKEAQERARLEKQQQAGRIALEQAQANDAAKTDEDKALEEAEAKAQLEAAQKAEAERVAAELEEEAKSRAAAEAAFNDQAAGEEERGALPANTRILKAGSIIHLNGEECVLPVDAAILMQHCADEQHFASILAREPHNLEVNADRLRLVYSPMNGTPLPLSSQRLSLDEMTEQERLLFEAPSRPRK